MCREAILTDFLPSTFLFILIFDPPTNLGRVIEEKVFIVVCTQGTNVSILTQLFFEGNPVAL